MAEPFLSEIRIVSFDFPPKGWALCNGQFMPINQNQALFALLGTRFGGNGQTNFALPNLQGRVPIHVSNEHTLGEAAGNSSVTLTQQTMPTHQHFLQASSTTANTDAPASDSYLGASAPNDLYAGPGSLVALNTGTVSNVGGSQPHNNMMPYLVLNFIIALQGIFPSPN